MHDCDAWCSNRMRLHGWRIANGVDLNPKFTCNTSQFVSSFADDERPAIELMTSGFKGLLGTFHLDILESIPKRHQRVVCIVIDKKHRTAAVNAARRTNLTGHPVHCCLENLLVGDAHGLDICKFTHRP